jgi:hypothetical protein
LGLLGNVGHERHIGIQATARELDVPENTVRNCLRTDYVPEFSPFSTGSRKLNYKVDMEPVKFKRCLLIRYVTQVGKLQTALNTARK